MSLIITDQASTIEFLFSTGERTILDKDNLNIKEENNIFSKWVYISNAPGFVQTAENDVIKIKYSEVTSPVVISNQELITLILGYKASSGYTVGDVRITDGVDVAKIESNGSLAVTTQDQPADSVDLYLHTDKANPTITVDPVVGDKQITVNSIVNVNAGEAITINEGVKTFQSIIIGASSSVITFATPLDYDFSTAATVSCGAWNMNVDGSSTPVVFHLIPPSGAKWDLYTLNVSITDDVVMDSGKFGGLPQLTNGVFARIIDGVYKNLPVIVNNLGFAEIGFITKYDDKAPAGVYGFIASKNWHEVNGISVRLDGATSDEFQIIIQDDLTGLSHMAITVNGYVIQD